jgi:AcrR family transcriptional regulator
VERGFPAVTFQEVAARAGVGRATLYRRWDDPAALVADAVRASAADRIRVADTGSLSGDLRHILELIARFIASPLGSASLIASLPSLVMQRQMMRCPINGLSAGVMSFRSSSAQRSGRT